MLERRILSEENGEGSGYLTFKALESGTFKNNKNAINYSTDGGATWIELAANTNSPTISAGSKIMWKATLTPNSNYGIGTFSSSGNFEAEGNPMSLLFGDNFSGQTSLSGKDYAFLCLFMNCSKLISIEKIVLPATTLAQSCYYYMFRGCTSLTTVPNDLLPATVLTPSCYRGIFEECRHLTNVPNLPAETLASYCYESMFYNCESILSLPSNLLPATTLAEGCYLGMFLGCSLLISIPNGFLPATTLAKWCYMDMFCNCWNIADVPSNLLPATTLAEGCYLNMFAETAITTAPNLPARELVKSCYASMFYYCGSLLYIKCLATDISADMCTDSWVLDIYSEGTFVKYGSMSDWTRDSNGIPEDWIIQNAYS